jgi:signal peptidase II
MARHNGTLAVKSRMPEPAKSPAGTHFRDYLPLLAIAIPIILLDQVTSLCASLDRGNVGAWDWLPTPLFHVKNTGRRCMLQGFRRSFHGALGGGSDRHLYYFPQVPRKDWALRLAMGLQFGGAIGNLIDRLTIGWVTDFFSVGTFQY